MRLGLPLLATCVLASTAGAAGNAHLTRAEGLLHDLRCRDVLRALDAAQATAGNDRSTVIRIFEMRGLCEGLLNHAEKATAEFEKLLALDPDHKLDGDWPPKVTTPFLEARAWGADHPPIHFEAAPAAFSDQGVQSLQVEATSDSLHLAKQVRFHLRADRGGWTEVTAAIDGGAAQAPASGAHVAWWAELLGDSGAVLAQVGSAESPLEANAPAAAAPAPPPPEAKAETPPPLVPAPPPAEPAATATATVEAPPARYRPAAYAAMGAGAVGFALGAYFGARSAQDLSTLNKAQTDPNGVITGINQHDAFALDQERRTDAVLGNTLMGAGAALVVGGAALWWWGGKLAVAPGPNGVAVAGELP